MTVTLVVLVLAVLGLLLAEYHDRGIDRAAAKLLASSMFVIAAVSTGAAGSAHGAWILVALIFSWLGDACLLSKNERTFLAGLAAFLLAHVAYCAAFLKLGAGPIWVLGGIGALAIPVAGVVRWLMPHVPGPMKTPVVLYVVVISAMVALAVGAVGRGASPGFLVAAVAFLVSDIAVARDRFVSEDVLNRIWGLPLYYFAQVLFVLSI
jgi:uncharacterized membrane protein YhhN